MATVEEVIQNIDQGAQIAATMTQLAAPIVAATGNPAAAAVMSLTAPIAADFIVKLGELTIKFREDVSVEDLIKMLQASTSPNWPTPPSIEPTP